MLGGFLIVKQPHKNTPNPKIPKQYMLPHGLFMLENSPVNIASPLKNCEVSESLT